MTAKISLDHSICLYIVHTWR